MNNVKKTALGLLINFIVLCILLVFVVTVIQVTTWQIVILCLWTCCAIYFLFSTVLWFRVSFRKKLYINSRGEDILIVAPHQDDGVAIAGGYAIQTMEKGGTVHILFVTDGSEEDKVTRRNESVDAWSVIGVPETQLHFLKYHTLTSLIDRLEIEKCIKEIEGWMQQIRPETVFVPLYEGGNFQHDVTNYMVNEVIKRFPRPITVYEASEYNFYFSLKTTPEKILSGLFKVVPLVHHYYPPEPVRNDLLYLLKMTQEQILLKQNMLSQFTTQHPDRLVERFGFEDRYQLLCAHDYSKPPFRYEGSLAQKINNLKVMPIIGGIISKMIRWTKTIHPDPEYTMTEIPLHKEKIG